MSAKEQTGPNGIAQIRDLIVGEEMASFRHRFEKLEKKLDNLQKQLETNQNQMQRVIEELKQGHSENLKSTEAGLLNRLETVVQKLEDLEKAKLDRETLADYFIETGQRLKKNPS